MKRQAWITVILFLVIAALAFAATGCEKKTKVVETQPKTSATQPATSPKIQPVTKQVTLYYLKGEAPTAVRRSVVTGSDRDVAEVALEELVKGPDAAEKQQGLTTAIPAGTLLKSYFSEGEDPSAKMATADFSKELKNFGGGSARVQTITDQITKTIKANDPGVTTVEIKVEGVPAEESLQP